jgi:glycosyltransferase involved in cell wall biosynthesis
MDMIVGTGAETAAPAPGPEAALADRIAGLALSVVIPAYNEEGAVRATIEEVRRELARWPVEFEIIVVDDGSRDRTRAEAEAAGAHVEAQPVNIGYGAALKRGIRASRHPFIAILDADGTYPARHLPEMLDLAREADMVVGDRGAAMRNVPLIRRPAKFVLNSLANFLAERKLNDLNSGLRIFRRSALEPFIPLLPKKFSFTTTITLCMACNDHQLVYMPIEYRKRVGSSKIRPIDFLNFVVLVLRVIMLFNPLRIFLPLGSIFFGLGVLKLAYDLTQWNLSETAVFAFLTAIMVWSLGLIADMVGRLHLRP